MTKDAKGKALNYLRKGIIAHPTDTIYGLACLANNPRAIKALIDLVFLAILTSITRNIRVRSDSVPWLKASY